MFPGSRAPHSVKFGFYFERVARNVSVYSLYNTNGSYYFGSDTASPYDTGYGYSNLLLGSVQAYGEDSTRQVNHARYNQFEWFAQDSWKVNRRLTLDFGVRFQYPGALSSVGHHAWALQRPRTITPEPGGNPALSRRGRRTERRRKPENRRHLPTRARGLFRSRELSREWQSLLRHGAVQESGVSIIPAWPSDRASASAWDVFGNGKTALRGGFGIFYDRAFGVDTDGATSAGVGPISAPPAFQAPVYYNTTSHPTPQRARLPGTRHRLRRPPITKPRHL